LGSRELAGLQRFYLLACELGLARRGSVVRFYQENKAMAELS
jgi:hypothetical protein